MRINQRLGKSRQRPYSLAVTVLRVTAAMLIRMGLSDEENEGFAKFSRPCDTHEPSNKTPWRKRTCQSRMSRIAASSRSVASL